MVLPNPVDAAPNAGAGAEDAKEKAGVDAAPNAPGVAVPPPPNREGVCVAPKAGADAAPKAGVADGVPKAALLAAGAPKVDPPKAPPPNAGVLVAAPNAGVLAGVLPKVGTVAPNDPPPPKAAQHRREISLRCNEKALIDGDELSQAPSHLGVKGKLKPRQTLVPLLFWLS